MINKFFKIINNKYNKFFRFIFFLRYLLAIFSISIGIFLIIPYFINYEKKTDFIRDSLQQQYNLEIIKNEKIKFAIFPIPNLTIKNTQINFNGSSRIVYVKNLKIFPKFKSIYNFENFKINKIILKNINTSIDVNDLKNFIKKFFNQSNKISINKLDLKILNNNNSLLKIKNIKFSNHGYSKNIFSGNIFDKQFKANIYENFKKINFKILNSGFSADINFDDKIDKDTLSGVFKSKILKSKLKLDFIYNNQQINIYNSYFRNKNLSFENESLINLSPFFESSSKIQIEHINTKIFKKLDIDKILDFKDIIKKINSKNEINFKTKKFSQNFIDRFDLKFDLAYGNLNYLKKVSISKNLSICEGNLNFLEEYPILFFDCSLNFNNKKKLLKIFSIKSKNENQNYKLFVKGNLNILNKKINFKNISTTNKYKASKEDLLYYKQTFENIIFNKSFFEIFEYKKIRNFILEIS